MKDDVVGGRGRESDCQDKKTKYLAIEREEDEPKRRRNSNKKNERRKSDLLYRKCV